MQTSYSNQPANAFSGMLADISYQDVVSRIASAHQLFSVVVTTEYNSEIFTVTIDGTAYAYAADSTATKGEIAAGLKALIDAGSADVTVTLFTTSTSNDSFYLENNSLDAAITVSVTNPAHGVLTLAELITFGQSIPFGRFVCEDERVAADSLTGKREGCRLPRVNADVTSRKIVGVAIADTSKVAGASGYAIGESVPVVRKGRVWVHVEDVASVAAGGLVYVRSTAGVGENLGDCRAADDSTDTDPIDSNAAQFTGQKIAALNLAVVDLNLP